jgi:hypothetical protein
MSHACDCCGKQHDNDDDYCAACYERVWRVGQPMRTADLDALAAYDQPQPTRDPRSVSVLPLATEMVSHSPHTLWAIPALEARTQLGKARYGDALHTYNGRDPVRDLREEILDAVQYLAQAIAEGRIHGDQADHIEGSLTCIVANLKPDLKEVP